MSGLTSSSSVKRRCDCCQEVSGSLLEVSVVVDAYLKIDPLFEGDLEICQDCANRLSRLIEAVVAGIQKNIQGPIAPAVVKKPRKRWKDGSASGVQNGNASKGS